MVFSFQHYLSFVERFVENMLSRKCLMFNTSFIIFNNSTKIRGVLSVIFMNRTHPPTSKNVMLMLQYLFTTVRQRQANKQEDIQLKAVVLLLSCRIMTLLFSFAPYNLLKMVARNRAAPYEFIRKQRATIIGKPYNVCQMPLEVSCFCWTSDTVNKPSLYIDLITAWSFMAVTWSISTNSPSLIHKSCKLDGMDNIPFPSTVITVLFMPFPPLSAYAPWFDFQKLICHAPI